jgi:hypothetical protein
MTWNASWTSSIFKPAKALSVALFLLITIQSHGFTGRSDSVPPFEPDTTHKAKKAVLLSAFIPGAGQVYNHRKKTPTRKGSSNLWKVPVIYAGLGALAYSFSLNNSSFKTWNNYYLERDGDTTGTIHLADTHEAYSGLYTLESLESISNTYRRRRDLSVIGLIVVYGLNLIDASVYAHLYNFDVSDNISFHWEPKIFRPNLRAQSPIFGLSLSLRL